MTHTAIDVHGLFHSENITSEVLDRLPRIPQIIASMREIFASSEPAIDIGPHCTKPYECDYKSYCWNHIPEISVFTLAGRGVDKFKCYKLGQITYDQLLLEDLNEKQQQQVTATLNKENFVDKEAVSSFLEELWYPLCHLDFETFHIDQFMFRKRYMVPSLKDQGFSQVMC